MTTICPCITASTREDYQLQIERVAEFAERLHIDVTDGEFTPVKLIDPTNVYWPNSVVADVHVMYQEPLKIFETLVGLQAQTIIIPAEATGATEFIHQLEGLGIKRGVALLQDTSPEVIKPYLEQLDHVLIFSGDLGHFGGKADLALLEKVATIKQWRADLEIGWDGGISMDNIQDLIVGGVTVCNVGGGIQQASDPRAAYEALQEAVRA